MGLPYFEGFINVVFRILLKFNNGVYIYPHKTSRNTLSQLKEFVDLIYKHGAIYKISCKDCSSVQGADYIWEYRKVEIIFQLKDQLI